jgi:DNA-binding transcriptional ArsR family regulator
VNELLAELFSSKVRAAVLGQMLPRAHAGYSLTELSRILDLPISSLQHECYKLERIGVIKGRREGNSRRYRVNPGCPVLREITALVVRAIGEGDALRAALEDLEGLQVVFLARTFPLSADDTDQADVTPIPLVLIGELGLEAIDAAQERVSALLGLGPNKIEAVFYRPGDWRDRLAQGSQYAVWLVSGPRTDVIGDPLSTG